MDLISYKVEDQVEYIPDPVQGGDHAEDILGCKVEVEHTHAQSCCTTTVLTWCSQTTVG